MPESSGNEVEQIIGATFAIDHGMLDETLQPHAIIEFRRSLGAIAFSLSEQGGGEFIIQLFLEDDPQQLAEPDRLG